MTGSGRAAGRWIDVGPARFPGWTRSFADRHGQLTVSAGPAGLEFRAQDGASAACRVPFPPLPLPGEGPAAGTGTQAAVALAELAAAHAAVGRTVGVVLVRLGGYSAGVFTGPEPVLAASKTGARLVHGRSAAGGWSQQRFARRRQQQATAALAAAAAAAATVLGRYAGRLDAVVLGGDRRAVTEVWRDPRLRPFGDLAVERFLTVPDPRLAVLRDSPRLFRSVQVWLTG